MNVLPLLMIPFAVGVGTKDVPKQPIELPDITVVGENYEIENSADSRYEELKAALDARFEKMFALKAELDKMSAENEAKWQEYWTMHEAYQRQLKRLIAVWVMDSCR